MALSLDIQIPPLPRWLIAPVLGGSRLMYVDMLDWWVSRFCMVDAFELDEIAIIRSLLRPGDTFVDIGANLGWFTLAASTVLGPEGRIHAFEPRPDTGERLGMTIELNGLSRMVTLHRHGVWSETCDLQLFVGDPTAPGSSHIAPEAAEGMAVTIPVRTLDSLELAACHVVKIDIEGAEPHAFRGAVNTIARHRPYILSELNGAQLMSVSQASMADYLGTFAALEYDAFYASGIERATPIAATDYRLAMLAFASVLFVPREKGPIAWPAT